MCRDGIICSFACLLTISDSMVSKKKTTSEEREKLFINMIEIALETALEL